MRKAAGFLLVLLLATLVVITTSSGDETDSSHVVHLSGGATYGPQIETCGDCHPVSTECIDVDDPYPCCTGLGEGCSWSGMYTDLADFANTTTCDTCHSPGGAFDGVDDPNIGAKPNWSTGASSLVFDGSGNLQSGKEKWCVGCHDDVPSVIKGVSAPNIAGNDIDDGYYKTGHGKFGSECLDCHDPDVTHVDADARTYSAGSLNYQAGYRLKSVGGLAPL